MNFSAIKWIVVAAFLLSPALSLRLNPDDYTGGYSMEEGELERRNNNPFAIILGELRANAADLIFIKTERYLDSGIAYMPHIELGEEEEEEHEEEAHVDDHEGHDHEDEHGGTPTIIPSHGDDFRGFIGWLHREVKPWRDPSLPHEHTTGDELLPWYRVMAVSNPHNVRAYLIGAWWLKNKEGQFREQALSFLDEGIKYNPRAFQLHLMRGYTMMEMEKPVEALPSFVEATELALAQRPPEGPTEKNNWTEYQEDDTRAAARMAVLLERRHGSKARALEMGRAFVQKLGGDVRIEAQISEMEAGQ